MGLLVPAIIALPLLGSAVLSLFGARLSKRIAGVVGASTVSASALLAFLAHLMIAAPDGYAGAIVSLGRWFELGALRVSFALHLDPLSSVMALVVSGVAALIHLYSIEYMLEEPDRDYARFFALMNFFVASMLCLVLADDLVLLYLGWEGVGVASFLLIGFWYRDPNNVAAARKAFVMTRIGDAALALGLLLLFTQLDSFRITELFDRIDRLGFGSPLAEGAAQLLFLGALAKSAQLPLSTWLPDAMAGPTPVSALIHAATMVTAGVYLIARMFPLFANAPDTLLLIAAIGAATAIYGALNALFQRELKRILAYSTISQLGLMFLALGAAAPAAAIFHLVTHAFFKALLFLVAGAITVSLFGATEIHQMRGLRHTSPWLFWKLAIGAGALAGLPLITAGFYSKELILSFAFVRSPWLWIAGLAASFLTSLYAFRVVWLSCFAPAVKMKPRRGPGYLIKAPITALAALSILAGFIEPLFIPFLGEGPAHVGSIGVQLAAVAASLGGVLAAYLLFRKGLFDRARALGPLNIDALYDRAVVRPSIRLARAAQRDIADAVPASLTAAADEASFGLGLAQDGRIRTYAAAMTIAAIALSILVLSS